MWNAVSHILSYDVWFYASHVALHTRALYWMHKKHHEKKFPTWRDTYHESGLEGVVQSLGYFVPVVFLGWVWISALVAAVFLNVRGMLQHDERGAKFVGHHHLDHHEHFNGNYGQPWLDWMFGTAISPQILASSRRQFAPPPLLQASSEQETRCSESVE